jgi:membrane protease YdiL (CAAX protease family)
MDTLPSRSLRAKLDQPIPRGRWWIHCAVFTGYLLAIFVRPWLAMDENAPAVLPADVPGLLWVSFVNMAIFAIVVALAWLASRASLDDFGLRWRGWVRPILLGAAYSVLLRIGLFLLITAVITGMIIWKGQAAAQSAVEQMRPDTGRIISASALTADPVYLLLCITLVSFVVAGLREELWRAGLMAGIVKLLAPRITGKPAQFIALAFTSVLFGAAHFQQGWGAVALTGLLGVGFGFIILWHRSVWEAAIAHGFFDATTFLGIYAIVKYFPGKVPGF